MACPTPLRPPCANGTCPKPPEILHQCLILHGHYGYTTDLPHHQRYNDVLGLQIGDGTAQIQKLVIAREKVGRMALQYDKKAKGASK